MPDGTLNMPRAEILAPHWRQLDAGEPQQAFEGAHALVDQLQGAERHDGLRLMGLALYYQLDYGRAAYWFNEGCQGSEEASDWYHLALAATMDGDLERGVAAFEQVRLCHQAARHGQHPGFYVHVYGYAHALGRKGEHARLRPLLDELAVAFGRLHNTDTGFLYARQMPFLSSVLALATGTFRARNCAAEGIAWLEALAPALDEPGQRQVGAAIQDLLAAASGLGG